MVRPSSYKTRHIPRKHKTTTKEGKNEYMKRYMQIRRKELRHQEASNKAISQISLIKSLGIGNLRRRK